MVEEHHVHLHSPSHSTHAAYAAIAGELSSYEGLRVTLGVPCVEGWVLEEAGVMMRLRGKGGQREKNELDEIGVKVGVGVEVSCGERFVEPPAHNVTWSSYNLYLRSLPSQPPLPDANLTVAPYPLPQPSVFLSETSLHHNHLLKSADPATSHVPVFPGVPVNTAYARTVNYLTRLTLRPPFATSSLSPHPGTLSPPLHPGRASSKIFTMLLAPLPPSQPPPSLLTPLLLILVTAYALFKIVSFCGRLYWRIILEILNEIEDSKDNKNKKD